MEFYLVRELRFLGLILSGLQEVFLSTLFCLGSFSWTAVLLGTDCWIGVFKLHQLACSVNHHQSRGTISIFSAPIRGACGCLLLVVAAWQSCIFWTWQERNGRLHRNTFRSPDALIRLIDRQIRDRILSYRERSPRLSSKMMQQWIAWLFRTSVEKLRYHRRSTPPTFNFFSLRAIRIFDLGN